MQTAPSIVYACNPRTSVYTRTHMHTYKHNHTHILTVPRRLPPPSSVRSQHSGSKQSNSKHPRMLRWQRCSNSAVWSRSRYAFCSLLRVTGVRLLMRSLLWRFCNLLRVTDVRPIRSKHMRSLLWQLCSLLRVTHVRPLRSKRMHGLFWQ